MRSLRGAEIPRALHAARLGLWGLVAALACLTVVQLVPLARGLAPAGSARGVARAETGPQATPSEAVAPSVQDFAVIWERMDPPRPEPKPAPKPPPAPAPKPAPPPDPYPSMRLLGTIVDSGGSYALLQVKPGTTQMLREGQSAGDISVVEVKDNEAVVKVPNYTKTLRLEQKSPGR